MALVVPLCTLMVAIIALNTWRRASKAQLLAKAANDVVVSFIHYSDGVQSVTVHVFLGDDKFSAGRLIAQTNKKFMGGVSNSLNRFLGDVIVLELIEDDGSRAEALKEIRKAALKIHSRLAQAFLFFETFKEDTSKGIPVDFESDWQQWRDETMQAFGLEPEKNNPFERELDDLLQRLSDLLKPAIRYGG